MLLGPIFGCINRCHRRFACLKFKSERRTRVLERGCGCWNRTKQSVVPAWVTFEVPKLGINPSMWIKKGNAPFEFADNALCREDIPTLVRKEGADQDQFTRRKRQLSTDVRPKRADTCVTPLLGTHGVSTDHRDRDVLNFFVFVHRKRVTAPNARKLSDTPERRGTCVVGEKAAVEAGSPERHLPPLVPCTTASAVTRRRVRCPSIRSGP